MQRYAAGIVCGLFFVVVTTCSWLVDEHYARLAECNAGQLHQARLLKPKQVHDVTVFPSAKNGKRGLQDDRFVVFSWMDSMEQRPTHVAIPMVMVNVAEADSSRMTLILFRFDEHYLQRPHNPLRRFESGPAQLLLDALTQGGISQIVLYMPHDEMEQWDL